MRVLRCDGERNRENSSWLTGARSFSDENGDVRRHSGETPARSARPRIRAPAAERKRSEVDAMPRRRHQPRPPRRALKRARSARTSTSPATSWPSTSPLRDHKEDVPALANYFLRALCKGIRENDHRNYTRSDEATDGLSLAGQCSRIAEHYRARRDAFSAAANARRRRYLPATIPLGAFPRAVAGSPTSSPSGVTR